ncbi:MAG: hypothetical protein AAGL98_08650, partial [Planctomycetota bacterium]
LPTEQSLGVDVDGDGTIEATVISIDARGFTRDVDVPGVGGTPDLGAFETQLISTPGPDILLGTPGPDLLLADQGVDLALSEDGNDGIFFGPSFSEATVLDAGDGDQDQVGLQGDYSDGITFGSQSAEGVEAFVLLPGSNTSFGAPGTEFYDYNFTLVDDNIGANQALGFQANTLRVGEDFTLDASAETDGLIFTFGGLGNESVTGSDNDDGFFFGTGFFGSGDQLDGHLGMFDSVGLQGDYSAPLVIGPNQFVSIELLVLLSSTDARFGAGSSSLFSYDVSMDDGNVASGQSMTISANTLIAGETFTFDGSAETDGFFLIFSGDGNDTISGSQGGDTIFGRGGVDTMTGNGGDDVFLYTDVSESAPSGPDVITDFTTGDMISLSDIDANTGVTGDQAFSFIGAAAFTAAGQLRAVNTSGNDWTVEGDVDGDGIADLQIQVTTSDGSPLDAADFVL